MRRVFIAVSLLVLPSAAVGSLQCVPDPVRAKTGQDVVVRLSSGAPFRGEAIGEGADGLERLWNSGRAGLPVVDDTPPVFRVDEPGVQLIAHETANGELVSYCKALVVVGDAPAGETIWRSELGHRLEIIPRSDPVHLAAAGGGFEAQILFDREPLVGAIVTAVSKRGGKDDYKQVYSNARGNVRLDLGTPGTWLVHLAHKVVEPDEDPGWSLFESSIVFDVGGD